MRKRGGRRRNLGGMSVKKPGSRVDAHVVGELGTSEVSTFKTSEEL